MQTEIDREELRRLILDMIDSLECVNRADPEGTGITADAEGAAKARAYRARAFLAKYRLS